MGKFAPKASSGGRKDRKENGGKNRDDDEHYKHLNERERASGYLT